MLTEFWLENLKGRDHQLEDVDTHIGIILEWVIWFGTGTSGGPYDHGNEPSGFIEVWKF
jgi:hypothetical protein